MTELWIETGNITKSGDQKRFIPIHLICDYFSPNFCKLLPAAHCLTGCDSVSAFYRIGKKSVIKCPVKYDKGFGKLIITE